MQYSITRGLAELKLLDKRIQSAIKAAPFVSFSVGKNPVSGFNTNEAFEDKSKAAFQSVQDLIARRNEIKSAIVVSNATTEVEVGTQKMTVAEAIERKDSIGYKKMLLNKLRQDFAQALSQFEHINANVKNRFDTLLQSQLGSDGKNKNTDHSEFEKAFKEANEAKLVNPLDARTIIDTLEQEIDEFESNVDYVLSTSNTLTMIEVSG